MTTVNEQHDLLKAEVVKLFEHLQKIKHEVASIKHPLSEINHFHTVADQLTAIVEATEEATEIIMEATEDIGNSATELGKGADAKGVVEYSGRITDKTNQIFEACSFQDITGQRISKIVKEMNLIEGTLNSLVVILGEEGLKTLPLVDKEIDDGSGDDIAMHGPELDGEGVSQDEIDKMFD